MAGEPHDPYATRNDHVDPVGAITLPQQRIPRPIGGEVTETDELGGLLPPQHREGATELQARMRLHAAEPSAMDGCSDQGQAPPCTSDGPTPCQRLSRRRTERVGQEAILPV